MGASKHGQLGTLPRSRHIARPSVAAGHPAQQWSTAHPGLAFPIHPVHRRRFASAGRRPTERIPQSRTAQSSLTFTALGRVAMNTDPDNRHAVPRKADSRYPAPWLTSVVLLHLSITVLSFVQGRTGAFFEPLVLLCILSILGFPLAALSIACLRRFDWRSLITFFMSCMLSVVQWYALLPTFS